MHPHPALRTAAAVLALVTVALAATAAPATAAPVAEPSPAGEAEQYRVIGPETFDDVDAVARTGAAIDEVDDGKLYVTATPAEVVAIRKLGFDLEPIRLPLSPDATIQSFPPGYEGYHTFDELDDVVDTAVADHPAIARRISIGTSHEGRDLIAVKISDNVDVDEGEPEVLFNAGQHAREHLTIEMAIYLLRMFTEEYGVDPRVTQLVDDRVIWILPNVNPDGAEYDIATGSFRSWRKNRQPTPGSSYVGTDLNRNWGYQWGGSGSSGSPSSSTYRGPAPFSAPETDLLRQFVLSRVIDGEQRITVNIDFHTYSELVLWPYGYTTASLAPGLDADARSTFQTIGAQLAATNGYDPMQASQLYIASGVSIDWMWADQGIFAYTFEMFPGSAGGGGFYPPDSVIAQETARNREASLILAEYADCPWRAIGEQQQYCGTGGGGEVVFEDDFSTSTGWTADPSGTDTATTGLWERAASQATSWSGTALQLATPAALVTGPLAGSSAGSHDVDGGVTSVRSPAITLPPAGTLTLTLSWYLAHLNNASAADFLRVSIQHDGGTTVVLDQAGSASNRSAAWTASTIDLTPYAGQDIRIVAQAADLAGGSLVEAAIDDVRVTADG
jgi:carboxypeptidase T